MRLNLIDGPYLQDLLDQPQALRRTWERLSISSELCRLAVDLRAGRFRRIVLTGMGSSYHALYPLYLALTQAGYAVQLAETSELIHFMSGCLTPDTLVIGVSQSGRSAETLGLLERTVAGVPLIAVTNDSESPLARAAQAVVLMHAGPEASVSCKTYVASLLALEWLAAVLTGRDLNPVKDKLAEAALAVQGFFDGWHERLDDMRTVVQGVRQVFVVGRGPSLATAGTGGLILKEAARFAAEGMSSAAFRHGPLESVNESVLVAVLAGSGACAVLNRRLAIDIRNAGGRAEIVDETEARPAFRLPAVQESLRPLVEILPVQLLSLALAEMNGHEPGRFELASKITSIE